MKKALIIIFSTLFAILFVFTLGASAEELHEHVIAPNSYYMPISGGQQHNYVCECGEGVVADCVFENHYYNGEEHWTASRRDAGCFLCGDHFVRYERYCDRAFACIFLQAAF